jgi:tetratricopeptide (TPR) repeat protein
MKIDHIRASRPWTAAEFDLVSAELAYARTNDETATDHANRALAWGEASGHQHIRTRALLILAKRHLRAGSLDEANKLLSEAQVAANACGFALQQVDGLILAGYLALAEGDFPRAEAAAAEADSISQPLPYRWGMGDAAHLLARCAEAQGQTDDALRHAERALSIRKGLQDPKVTYTEALIQRLSPDKKGS